MCQRPSTCVLPYNYFLRAPRGKTSPDTENIIASVTFSVSSIAFFIQVGFVFSLEASFDSPAARWISCCAGLYNTLVNLSEWEIILNSVSLNQPEMSRCEVNRASFFKESVLHHIKNMIGRTCHGLPRSLLFLQIY